jgi:transcriptional regulator with XRE-family HTH domain
MKTGDRVKQRRVQLGMSVDQLASKLGKNRATVYRYENNDIENLPTSILPTLAEALETTPAYLMGWESNPDKGTFKYNYNKFIENIVAEVFEDKKPATPEETHRTRLKGIIRNFEKLNLVGQMEALKRVEELTYISKYVNKKVLEEYPQRAASSDYLVINAANDILNASTEDKQHDDDIMNDENF